MDSKQVRVEQEAWIYVQYVFYYERLCTVLYINIYITQIHSKNIKAGLYINV